MINYSFYCCVLQRTLQNSGISQHYDDCHDRIVTFMYYLTPEGWDDNDGGHLHLIGDQKDTKISYEFNKLVLWNIEKMPKLEHYVEIVNAPDDKPRIALVGFINKNGCANQEKIYL